MPIISEATFGTSTRYNDDLDSILESVGSPSDFQGFGDMMMAQAINEAKIFEYLIADDYAELDAMQESAGYNTGKFGLNNKYSADPKEHKSIKQRYNDWAPENKAGKVLKKAIDTIVEFVKKWYGKLQDAIEGATTKVINFIKPKLDKIREKLNYVKKADKEGKLDTCPVPGWYFVTDDGRRFEDRANALYNSFAKDVRAHAGSDPSKTYRSSFETSAGYNKSNNARAIINGILVNRGFIKNDTDNAVTKKDLLNKCFEKKTKGLHWSDLKSKGISIDSLHADIKELKSVLGVRKSAAVAKKTVKEFIASIKKREKVGLKKNETVSDMKAYASAMCSVISMVSNVHISLMNREIRQSFATLMALIGYTFPGRQAEKGAKAVAGAVKKIGKKHESADIFTESVWYEAAADFTEAVTDYYSESYDYDDGSAYFNESDDMDDDFDFED